MADASARREDYLFLHRTVLKSISILDNMLDPSQIDGVVVRLDWVYLDVKTCEVFLFCTYCQG